MTQACTIASPRTEVGGNTQRERIKCIMDKLEEGVQAVFDSDRYQDYLSCLAKFHRYSANNIILIMSQCPEASLVAGYGDWIKKHHRYVRKGETAIRILAPSPYKRKVEREIIDKDGKAKTEEAEIIVPAFKVVNVFDISQTEGEPLPSLDVEDLETNVPRYLDFLDALHEVSPVPIRFKEMSGSSHGYYSHDTRDITVRRGMGELQTVKTLIHEIAHATLHSLPEGTRRPKDGPDRGTREVQAESVAFVVCQHFGLDTSDYSFGYIAGWSDGREMAELKASLDAIRQASHDLIEGLEDRLGRNGREATA